MLNPSIGTFIIFTTCRKQEPQNQIASFARQNITTTCSDFGIRLTGPAFTHQSMLSDSCELNSGLPCCLPFGVCVSAQRRKYVKRPGTFACAQLPLECLQDQMLSLKSQQDTQLLLKNVCLCLCEQMRNQRIKCQASQPICSITALCDLTTFDTRLLVLSY